MVKDFIEQRIDQAIRATFGPCKADLAEAAVATRRSLSGAIGGCAPGNDGRHSRGDCSALGAANALGSMGALGAGGGDMAGAMAMLQQMMSAPPLTDAEFDDVVRRLERFGKVAESIEPGIACSADDYRRMLGTVRVAGGPMGGMGGGMLRLMHTQLLEAEQRLAETATMFEQMAPEDRVDMAESLATDLRSGPPEGRRATLAMMDAGMLRMPPDMAAAMRARLQP